MIHIGSNFNATLIQIIEFTSKEGASHWSGLIALKNVSELQSKAA